MEQHEDEFYKEDQFLGDSTVGKRAVRFWKEMKSLGRLGNAAAPGYPHAVPVPRLFFEGGGYKKQPLDTVRTVSMAILPILPSELISARPEERNLFDSSKKNDKNSMPSLQLANRYVHLLSRVGQGGYRHIVGPMKALKTSEIDLGTVRLAIEMIDGMVSISSEPGVDVECHTGRSKSIVDINKLIATPPPLTNLSEDLCSDDKDIADGGSQGTNEPTLKGSASESCDYNENFMIKETADISSSDLASIDEAFKDAPEWPTDIMYGLTGDSDEDEDGHYGADIAALPSIFSRSYPRVRGSYITPKQNTIVDVSSESSEHPDIMRAIRKACKNSDYDIVLSDCNKQILSETENTDRVIESKNYDLSSPLPDVQLDSVMTGVKLLSKTEWENRTEKACYTCETRFNFINRRHHCRICGGSVCGGCSPFRVKFDKSNKRSRVCTSCYIGVGTDNLEEDVVSRDIVMSHIAKVKAYSFEEAKRLMRAAFGELQVLDSVLGKGLTAKEASGILRTYADQKKQNPKLNLRVLPQDVLPVQMLALPILVENFGRKFCFLMEEVCQENERHKEDMKTIKKLTKLVSHGDIYKNNFKAVEKELMIHKEEVQSLRSNIDQMQCIMDNLRRETEALRDINNELYASNESLKRDLSYWQNQAHGNATKSWWKGESSRISTVYGSNEVGIQRTIQYETETEALVPSVSKWIDGPSEMRHAK